MSNDEHWLVRPENIKKWWVLGVVILALTVAAELLIHRHDYFKFDGFFAFNAIFGFIGAVFLVAVAKAVGAVLRRDDSYYDFEND